MILERLAPPPGLAWTTVDDVARVCPFPVGGDSTAQAQRWILDRRKGFDDLGGLVVSDGCMLNDAAYYRHWTGAWPQDLNEALERARGYDLLLALPPDPRLCVGDGLRPVDSEFLNRIDALQTEAFAGLAAPLWRLPRFDQWSREEFVVGPLRALYQDKVLRQRFVALAFVVDAGRLLMVRRPVKGTPEADGLWDVVAGVIEFGETPAETCVRECQEEMGLCVRTLEPLGPPATRTWQESGGRQFQALTMAFRCELTGPSAPTPSPREVADWRWMPIEAVPTLELVPNIGPYLEVLQGG